MPNDYFQFKQFKINQARSGMKVTTEACLFAALIEGSKSQSILDIGSGTGLLGLMLAQRLTAEVSCVEIELFASLDMEQNIKQSPWSNRINGYHEDIQDFLVRRSGGIRYHCFQPTFLSRSSSGGASPTPKSPASVFFDL